MFGIGLPELIVIAVVALIFIGPKNLPGVLRSLGRGLVQIKRATNDVRDTMQEEMNRIENEIDLKDVKDAATDLQNDFDGITNNMDPLSLNRMNTEEQLKAVANVMEPKDKNQKTEGLKHENVAEKRDLETMVPSPLPSAQSADQENQKVSGTLNVPGDKESG